MIIEDYHDLVKSTQTISYRMGMRKAICRQDDDLQIKMKMANGPTYLFSRLVLTKGFIY